MKALIFAAGLGTRLGTVTQTKPKALVEVGGKPMLERVILNLKNAGVRDVLINLHHFPELIKVFLKSKNHFGMNIQFTDESNEILETGGGLMKAAWFFDDGNPFIVHNVDVLTDLNLVEFYAFHQKHKPRATLFVQKRESSRYLMFDDENSLCGWINKKTGQKIIARQERSLRELAFNGIHIIDPEIFNLIKMKGKFSIVPAYLELARDHSILGYMNNGLQYIDIGKPESLLKAEMLAREID